VPPFDFLSLFRPKAQSAQFSQWSIADRAAAEWWLGTDNNAQESVTPYTVLGLAAVQRAVAIISTTIAGLPLKTYERDDRGEKHQIESEFDDPYPGIDGMTPFAWVETILMHSLIWRHAFLWHEARMDGTSGLAYRPIVPDAILRVKRENGRRVFEYRESGTTETKEVGSEQITYIPGPSIDGTAGHPLLYAARAVFSAAISADKTTQRHLRRGIRLGGLLTPAAVRPGESADANDVGEDEAKKILEGFRSHVVGSENAGDVAFINRRVELQKWQSTNVEAQWRETLSWVLMEIEQLFGVPPHLMADTEKQTSWGTGVAEQNLGLSRFTLRGWSDRIEQVLSLRLPRGQFVEFDYRALLQGTPAQEIELLLKQTGGKPILTVDEARKVQNRPSLTPAQKAELALQSGTRGTVTDAPESPTPSEAAV
jgi:HK97 family phage portal protein